MSMRGYAYVYSHLATRAAQEHFAEITERNTPPREDVFVTSVKQGELSVECGRAVFTRAAIAMRNESDWAPEWSASNTNEPRGFVDDAEYHCIVRCNQVQGEIPWR